MSNVSIKINNKVGTCLQQRMIEIIRELGIDSFNMFTCNNTQRKCI